MKLSEFFRLATRPVLVVCSLSSPQIVSAEASPVSIQGTVVDTADQPVPSAQIVFVGANLENPYSVLSDNGGSFKLSLPKGIYAVTVNAARTGTAAMQEHVQVNEGSTYRITLNPVDETAVTVSPDADASAPFLSNPSVTLRQMRNIPVTTDFNRIEDRLAMLPGMVLNSREELNIGGMPDDQSQAVLDGFRFSSPAPALVPNPRMPILGIQDVQLISSGTADGTVPPGLGGVIRISPRVGCSEEHYDYDNISPALTFQSGFRVSSWTPGVSLCGSRGYSLLWNQSARVEYTKLWVPQLGTGHNTNNQWLGESNTQVRWQISNGQSLTTGVLANVDHNQNAGLGITHPIETTNDDAYQYYFAHTTYSWAFRRGLIQAGGSDTQSHVANLPHGTGLLYAYPTVDLGSNYQTLRDTVTHPEFFTQAFVPVFSFLGSHTIIAGAGASVTYLEVSEHYTGIETFNPKNVMIAKNLYGAISPFDVSQNQRDAFVQDKWAPIKSLTLNIGVRTDTDSLTHSHATSPRLSIVYIVPHTTLTLYAGRNAIPYQENLQLFTRPSNWAITGPTDPAGDFSQAPRIALYEIGKDLYYPVVVNTTFGLATSLPFRFYFETQYTTKIANGQLAFGGAPKGSPVPLPLSLFPARSRFALYSLQNWASFDYHGLIFTVRKQLASTVLFATYTRSSAYSSASYDISSNTALVSSNPAGPLSWNIPNRVTGGGFLPWRKWTFGLFTNWQSGTPYTLYSESGFQVGSYNGYTFPKLFTVNVQVARQIPVPFFGKTRHADLVFVATNITNHPNYTSANPYLGAATPFLGAKPPAFTVFVRRHS